MISILILTLNEENNIKACIDSVAWSDDVVVLDSFSTDTTCALAKDMKARVFSNVFHDFAAQQNWAMKNIDFKNSWVFYLDADERMTEDLHKELKKVTSDASMERVAYYCSRKNYFMGRWIKHSFPPVPLMRFFMPSKIEFERIGHAPVPHIQGKHGYLKEQFDHYNFSKGFTEWFEKHNRYSQWEAEEAIKVRGQTSSNASLWSKDRAERRKVLKQWSYKLPLKPWIKFVYFYFLKLGFLDGYPGLIYCTLQSIYEYQIDLKIQEILRHEKGLSL